MQGVAGFSAVPGSGKAGAALTRQYTEHYRKAAMLSGDPGSGITPAVCKPARVSGSRLSPITDERICFCGEVLTGKLNVCFDGYREPTMSERCQRSLTAFEKDRFSQGE